MKRNIFTTTVAVVIFLVSIITYPITVFAWGDSYVDPDTGKKGRPSYTTEEVNQGALGDNIVFNSISDNTDLHEDGGSEKNFVAARECFQRSDGSWESVTDNTVWSNNDITVEDGHYYIIRLYVKNDNPNGKDAVAENTHVSFSIPADYDQENKRIQVNGFIDSPNAVPDEYWDYVNFNSETPFHLEYVYGSALLENNGLGSLAVGDDIVKAKSGGILIGYDSLNGEIPGGHQYDNYVTVKVRAVCEDRYSVNQRVRLAGGNEDDWTDTVNAKVGDKVEFRIVYENTSNESQTGVAIKDILPENLEYVAGSSVIKNSNHPNGAKIVQDSLVENGIRIGDYSAGANAYIYFTAEVVDEDLEQGLNVLTNWSQAGVGDVTIQDSAEVRIQNDAKYHVILAAHIVVILICFIVLVITICKAIKRHKIIRRK